MVHGVNIPPSQYWYCTLAITILFAAFLCSMLLIVSMTFDRFYSIIKPHKAASLNTIKRTKITIICIISFSIMYSIPHLFVSSHNGWQCMPYGNALKKPYGQFYYWLSFTINFVVPFVSLLVMNSVIINTLRKRSRFIDTNSTEEGQGKDKGQGQISGSSEKQVYAILLLVTFGFLYYLRQLTCCSCTWWWLTSSLHQPLLPRITYSTTLLRRLSTQTMESISFSMLFPAQNLGQTCWDCLNVPQEMNRVQASIVMTPRTLLPVLLINSRNYLLLPCLSGNW